MSASGNDAFKIDLQQLDLAIASMATFAADTAAILTDVSHSVAALRISWTGEGSDAYRDAQERWHCGVSMPVCIFHATS
ncbi:hypothetical protein CH275_12145 [Rhodococcus sp. 06-235-1A]|uniref:WXG100 family type VII secretion target n=1 Tax=Rhodococcus sp. 06-235-1A TaxID=2022508 RepID=UPI000B9A9220|nr:hypothetical protein CH275_12145 [Rhodococcus sp. 06-235-1A]